MCATLPNISTAQPANLNAVSLVIFASLRGPGVTSVTKNSRLGPEGPNRLVAFNLSPLKRRALRLAEQSQHVLRILVRNRQHRRAGLHQDLSPGERGRFGSEVGVADLAFGVGQVDQRVVQSVAVGFQRRALESTQATTEASDLVDRVFDDLSRNRWVGEQVSRTARAELEHLAADTAQAGRVHAGDTDAGLLVRHNVWTELELSTTTGDVEADRTGEAGFDRRLQVQGRGVDRDH